MSDNRNFTPEEWTRLCELLADRLASRLAFMDEALKGVVAGDPGGEITISMCALDGAWRMVDDMRRELLEALGILDF